MLVATKYIYIFGATNELCTIHKGEGEKEEKADGLYVQRRLVSGSCTCGCAGVGACERQRETTLLSREHSNSIEHNATNKAQALQQEQRCEYQCVTQVAVT